MKKSIKMVVAGLVFTAMMVTSLSNGVFARTEPVGGETCSSGTTGLCWIITTNGVKEAKCKSTTGSVKDCPFVAS
jgi:hypothetical protein